jgi:hypothetical protein
LTVNTRSSVSLTDVVVADNHTTLLGSGILNSEGTLALSRTTVRDNTNLSSLGGGGQTASGGGLANTNNGFVSIDRSTFSGNFALRGGGLINGGRMDVTNSTISGNTAKNSGGGILNVGDGSGATGVLSIAFTTIAFNLANRPGAADRQHVGGGIANFGGQVNVGSSILSDNDDGRNRFSFDRDQRSPDCYSINPFRFTSFRNNLVSQLSDNCLLRDTIFGDTSFDSVGFLDAPLDPQLGALASNGGPTATHALLMPGSPAFDAVQFGTSATFFDCPATDQRGRPRIAPCDIGSYEVQ